MAAITGTTNGTQHGGQSKTFYHGGNWWGLWYDAGTPTLYLWKYSGGTWATHLAITTAGSSRADVVLDAGNNTAYVLECAAGAGAAKVHKISFSAGSWTLDSGYPYTVTGIAGGAPTNGATLVRANNGRLMVFDYQAGSDLVVNWSTNNGVTWQGAVTTVKGTLPSAAGATCCEAFTHGGTDYVGVFYAPTTGSGGFLYIADTADPSVGGNWTDETSSLPNYPGTTASDDACAMVADADGRVYVATKTSGGGANDPALVVFTRAEVTSPGWSATAVVGKNVSAAADVACVLDTTNKMIYVGWTATTTGVHWARAEYPHMDFFGTTTQISNASDSFSGVTLPAHAVTATTDLPFIASNDTGTNVWESLLDIGAGGARVERVFFSDSFTDASGTLLSAHPGELEAAYTQAETTPFPRTIQSTTDGLRLVTTGGASGQGRYTAPGLYDATSFHARVVLKTGSAFVTAVNASNTIVSGGNMMADTTNAQKFFFGIVAIGTNVYARFLNYWSDASALTSISVLDNTNLKVNNATIVFDLYFNKHFVTLVQNGAVVDTVDYPYPFEAFLKCGVQGGNASAATTEANSCLIEHFSAKEFQTIPPSASTQVTIKRDPRTNTTPWTPGTPGTPTFTVAGIPGASVSSQQVVDADTALVTIAANASTGILRVMDSTTVADAVLVTGTSFDMDLKGGAVSTTYTTTHFHGVGTSWTGYGTPSSLFSISGGTGPTITNITVLSDTHATGDVYTGTAQAELTITDNSTSNTIPLLAKTTSATVVPGDDCLRFSPYTWVGTTNNPAWRVTNNPGAYFVVEFWATQAGAITLNFDAAAYSGFPAADWPTIRVSANGEAFTDTQLTTGMAGTVTLQSTCNIGPNRILLAFHKNKYSQNRWTDTSGDGPEAALRFKQVNLTTGALQRKPSREIQARAKNVIVYGDSITEGTFMSALSTPAGQEAYDAFPRVLAGKLGAEYATIGFASQAFLNVGAGNAPAFIDSTTITSSSYRFHYAGKARTIGTAPDYVFLFHGTNDPFYSVDPATLETKIGTMLGDMRTYFGANVVIVVAIPPAIDNQTYDGAYWSAISNATTTAAATDSNIVLVDMRDPDGTVANAFWGMTRPFGDSITGIATDKSLDGLHPDIPGHAMIGGFLAGANINPAVSGVSRARLVNVGGG